MTAQKKTIIGIVGSDLTPAQIEDQVRSALDRGYNQPVIFIPTLDLLNQQTPFTKQFLIEQAATAEEARQYLRFRYKVEYPLYETDPQPDPVPVRKSEWDNSDPVLVAIPARDCEELTFQCLAHLALYAGTPFHVLYIDDGSRPGVAERVKMKAESMQISIKVCRFEQSIGFARACNLAFCEPGYRHVLLLNNDCYVGPGCLSRLRGWLESQPKIAAVGPLTGDDGCLSLNREQRRQRADFTGDLINRYDPVEGAHLCQSIKATEEKMLPFFCTLFRSDAIQDIGLQSSHPDFGYGLGADDDWCNRALAKGWKLLACCNAFAAHLHKQSFQNHQIDREAMSQIALQHLREQNRKPPTLSIITRCHINRPRGFEVLRKSIEEQTLIGTQHVLLRSEGEIGIPGANRMLAGEDAVKYVRGDYVQVVDDDDKITSPEYIEQLQQFIISQGYPDWIMVRGRINERSYPHPWGQKWQPKVGTVACFCIITSRDLWEQHHHAWGIDKCGDWNFAKTLWEAGNRPVWFDFDGCETQNGHSNGSGESERLTA